MLTYTSIFFSLAVLAAVVRADLTEQEIDEKLSEVYNKRKLKKVKPLWTSSPAAEFRVVPLVDNYDWNTQHANSFYYAPYGGNPPWNYGNNPQGSNTNYPPGNESQEKGTGSTDSNNYPQKPSNQGSSSVEYPTSGYYPQQPQQPTYPQQPQPGYPQRPQPGYPQQPQPGFPQQPQPGSPQRPQPGFPQKPQPGFPQRPQPGYPQQPQPGFPQQPQPGFPQQPQPGYPQRPQPGFPQRPQPGFPQQPQPGFPQQPQPGFPQQPQPGSPQQPQPGFPQRPQPGFPQQPQPGFPQQPQPGFPQQPQPGFPQQPQPGFPQQPQPGFPQQPQPGFPQQPQPGYPQRPQPGYPQQPQPGYPQRPSYPQESQTGTTEPPQLKPPQGPQPGYPQQPPINQVYPGSPFYPQIHPPINPGELEQVLGITDSNSSESSMEELRKYCKAPRGQFGTDRSCNRFINCWDDVVVEQECGGSLLFNEDKKYCDYPDNVDCGVRPITESLTPANGNCPSSFGSFRSSSNCGEFFICVHGTANRFLCPGGLAYNDELGVCDYPYRVECNGIPLIPMEETPDELEYQSRGESFGDESDLSVSLEAAVDSEGNVISERSRIHKV